MKDIYVFGTLHIITRHRQAELHNSGITIHVKNDVIFHFNPNDVIILEGGDQIMEEPFEKDKIHNVIAYSNKFGKKQKVKGK